jgi:hypothetical protein
MWASAARANDGISIPQQSYPPVERREYLIAQQQLLYAHYEDAKTVLLALPGVVRVGMGLKEQSGKRTWEPCYRVYVREKLDVVQLPLQHRIPPVIYGLLTDVLLDDDAIQLFEDSTPLPDHIRYRPLMGGISIGTETSNGVGTLGAVVRRNSDSAIMMLSCHHVLYNTGGIEGTKVGQRGYIHCLCCGLNKVGNVVDGEKSDGLDCAIASIDNGIAYLNEVVDIGAVTEMAPRIVEGKIERVYIGETVFKRGRRTGYTEGVVVELAYKDYDILIECVIGEPHPVTKLDTFCQPGDSGSIIVNSQNQVVGLLWALDGATKTKGIANHIESVTDRLDISFDIQSGVVSEAVWASEGMPDHLDGVIASDPIDHLLTRILIDGETESWRALVDNHLQELIHLVNANRPVKIAWQRQSGPAWVAAIARADREGKFGLPSSVGGVPLRRMILQMAAACSTHGSPALSRDIDKFLPQLLQSVADWEALGSSNAIEITTITEQ